MSNDIYAIVDLDGYVSEMRHAASEYIAKNNQENLDQYITIKQMIELVNENCLGFDNQDRPILDETTNETIFEKTVIWIENVGLSKLASQGLIECSWDDESNEMIFWASNKEKNNVSKKPPQHKSRNKKNRG